ncbi:hypothetical protein GCM10011514_06180 [Emticicia aquatilis]|uniref:Uncharacterized protein n=1 Tax=Emticicia aquatilis TaxID=1537369 RepID=A0A917DKK0_9BACT|nr:hypothetical protein [Emticicia aquatilis]GGD44925.1 hypothetical protein GCM10011514_06180 [Emticicia aquatilis]
MENERNLITPRQALKNECDKLLASIDKFMTKAQAMGYRVDIDARLYLDHKSIRAELYKPLVEIEGIKWFDKKEVSDGE